MSSQLEPSCGYHTSALWKFVNTSHRSSTNTKLHSARQFAQHQPRLASRDRHGLRWQSSGTSEKASGKLNVNELQKSLAKTAVNAKERSTAFGSGVFRRLPAQAHILPTPPPSLPLQDHTRSSSIMAQVISWYKRFCSFRPILNRTSVQHLQMYTVHSPG